MESTETNNQQKTDKQLLEKIAISIEKSEKHLEYLHKVTRKDHRIKTIHTIIHSLFLIIILGISIGVPIYLTNLFESKIGNVQGVVEDILPDLENVKDKVFDSFEF